MQGTAQIETTSSNYAANSEDEERLIAGMLEAIGDIIHDSTGSAVKHLHLARLGTSHRVLILVNAGILSARAEPIHQPGRNDRDHENNHADHPEAGFLAV